LLSHLTAHLLYLALRKKAIPFSKKIKKIF